MYLCKSVTDFSTKRLKFFFWWRTASVRHQKHPIKRSPQSNRCHSPIYAAADSHSIAATRRRHLTQKHITACLA